MRFPFTGKNYFAPSSTSGCKIPVPGNWACRLQTLVCFDLHTRNSLHWYILRNPLFPAGSKFKCKSAWILGGHSSKGRSSEIDLQEINVIVIVHAEIHLCVTYSTDAVNTASAALATAFSVLRRLQDTYSRVKLSSV